MKVLVAYASRHGATQGIAERVAKSLAAQGHAVDVEVLPGNADLSGYDAFVVGSAVYMGRWRPEAAAFVDANKALLSDRPLWLFSSGPLGSKATDSKGRDLRKSSAPKDAAQCATTVHPRDHRVFFGALDPNKLKPFQRALRKLPPLRAAMPAGDFRDWDDIDHWAKGIAASLP
ncbi:MAG TPA: flavodoxin domain-containing protein [Acidimicrobiales bacterium]|nr:flavodoxin domain-containing protein [Acidimicrobiales bacterium]